MNRMRYAGGAIRNVRVLGVPLGTFYIISIIHSIRDGRVGSNWKCEF